MKSAAVPLTLEEEERKRNLEAEGGGVYTGGSSTYIHGVAFPLAAGVAGAVNEFRSGSKNYLRLGVDVDKRKSLLGTRHRSLMMNLEAAFDRPACLSLLFLDTRPRWGVRNLAALHLLLPRRLTRHQVCPRQGSHALLLEQGQC
jgi:hypothetical protein